MSERKWYALIHRVCGKPGIYARLPWRPLQNDSVNRICAQGEFRRHDGSALRVGDYWPKCACGETLWWPNFAPELTREEAPPEFEEVEAA